MLLTAPNPTRRASISLDNNSIFGAFFLLWLIFIIYVHLQTDRESAVEMVQKEFLFRGSLRTSSSTSSTTSKQPMALQEIADYLSNWISMLHNNLQQHKKEKAEGIWEAYHNLTIHTLYPWDQEYLQRMPPRRTDGSIFLSVATYRDENCMNTIMDAYEKAQNPEKLFVGLVQQNCQQDCLSGIMEDGKSHPIEPDPDCHKIVCERMPHRCSQIRALHIDEPESLGPYMARYFASKLWYGEEWYMQIDAHMTFYQNWDAISIVGLNKAPSDKPVSYTM